ncbi:MAG: methyltransferase domain-containing protein [Rhodobacteraceae bacterium]|nr:methyltransferase domain-containing protein [Paracoccaceae bacterium]
MAPPTRGKAKGWRNRLVASRGFQRWAARFPLTRGLARREGEALFDLVAGFVHSQMLHALIELRVLHILMDGPASTAALALRCEVPEPRMAVLLQAGAALGLLKRRRDGRFALARRGAALLGVPGLEAMILHHRALYRDLEDPVAFLRGGENTELADFWPYVFGASGDIDPDIAQTYSDLMADSQGLVAEETLSVVSLKEAQTLLDVGGGAGAFLAAALVAYPHLRGMLFDLPQVAPAAQDRLGRAGLAARTTIVPGSFRDGALPAGADAISLVRVLYDHGDDTVAALLRAARDALPPGGRLIVSEPMSGGDQPNRATDAYFAVYTMAMGTGRTRSAAQISAMLAEAGFEAIIQRKTHRPFVTGVVEARRRQT